MKDKKNLILIAVIMAAAATAMLLVVEITAVFLIAYGFVLVGIAGLLIAALQMTDKKDTYPWGAAIPLQAVTYLIIEVVISIVIVVLKELGVYAFPPLWFAVIHILVLAFFAVRIVMMQGGADHIEAVGGKTEAKISAMQSLRMEVGLLVEEPAGQAVKEHILKFAETVRYSDPVSNSQLVDVELEMVQRVNSLRRNLGDEDRALAELETLEQMLEQRNIKIKLLK